MELFVVCGICFMGLYDLFSLFIFTFVFSFFIVVVVFGIGGDEVEVGGMVVR
jgi:hypothetical protein